MQCQEFNNTETKFHSEKAPCVPRISILRIITVFAVRQAGHSKLALVLGMSLSTELN